jgi:hypothetical protein
MRIRKAKGGTPKYILNPKWADSEEAQLEREQIKDSICAFGDCVEDYFPEDYGKKLPEEGAWIMLLMSVHVGKEIAPGVAEPVTVPHLSIWFAMPTLAGSGTRYDIRPTKAIIQTPQGEVHIWPHEYTVVKDLTNFLEMTEEEGFYINFMREDGGFDVNRLHYIMSRGITKGVAQRILLPELKDPFFCYFTFHEAYSEMFGEGFGSGHLTAANHERRREARRRKTAVHA